MNPTLVTYADAMLALHGFDLTPEAREAVLRNVALSASIAAVFLDHDLGPEDEMAPVFRPVSAP